MDSIFMASKKQNEKTEGLITAAFTPFHKNILQ
jgi:hypothetical protein